MRQPVITISRQRGSGADDIAPLVAQQLGVPLYDPQVIARAAAEAGVSEAAMHDAERHQGFLSRMLESLGRYAGLDAEGAIPIAFSSSLLLATSADYRAVIEQVLRNIADTGAGVIVGHGGAQVALRRRPDVLHVFIHAPFAQRIYRMMAYANLDYEAAKKDVEETDRGRTEFFRTNYDVNWYDLRLYDLVLNSGGRTYAQVAELWRIPRTLGHAPDGALRTDGSRLVSLGGVESGARFWTTERIARSNWRQHSRRAVLNRPQRRVTFTRGVGTQGPTRLSQADRAAVVAA